MKRNTSFLFAVVLLAACGRTKMGVKDASVSVYPGTTTSVATASQTGSASPTATATETVIVTATHTETATATVTADTSTKTDTDTGTATESTTITPAVPTNDSFKIVSVTVVKFDANGNPAEDVRSFDVTFSGLAKGVWLTIIETASGLSYSKQYQFGLTVPESVRIGPDGFDMRLSPLTNYRFSITAKAASVNDDQSDTWSGEFTTGNFPVVIRHDIGSISALDAASGHLAWLAEDGSAQAFEPRTLMVRKVGDNAAAVSVNEEGKTAFIQRDATNHCMTVYIETRNLFSNCGFPEAQTVWPQVASIAYRGTNLVWTMQMTDTSGILNAYWYDQSSKDAITQLAISGFNTHELHVNGNNLGYITSGGFNAMNLISGKPACPQYPYGWAYNSAGNLNGTMLVFGSAYMGQGGISYQDMNDTGSGQIDDQPYPYSMPEGSMAVSDSNTVVWTTSDGLRFQAATAGIGNSQLIAGVSQFAVDGNTLYFVGTDNNLYQQGL
jgi:hypothetical protein